MTFIEPTVVDDEHRLFAINLFGSSFEFRQKLRDYDLFYCPKLISQFFWALHNFHGGRKLTFTENSVGVGPADSRGGDLIYLVDGASTPIVLRQIGNNKFLFIGDCFVQFPSKSDDHYETCGIDFELTCSCVVCDRRRNWRRTISLLQKEVITLV
jgi:hypothetical protein